MPHLTRMFTGESNGISVQRRRCKEAAGQLAFCVVTEKALCHAFRVASVLMLLHMVLLFALLARLVCHERALPDARRGESSKDEQRRCRPEEVSEYV